MTKWIRFYCRFVNPID